MTARRPKALLILGSALVGGLVVALAAVAGGIVGFARGSVAPSPVAAPREHELTIAYTQGDGVAVTSVVRVGATECARLGESFTLSAPSREYGDALGALGGGGELAILTFRFDGKVFVADEIPAFDGDATNEIRVGGGINSLVGDEVGPPLAKEAVLSGSLRCDHTS